jgi:5-methylcytosine-specific restriction endonuclease McrA
MVFVLDKHNKPLAPCHPAKARKLLKKRKATIVKRYPFTIKLKYNIKLNEENDTYRIKIDYGSRYTGLAILKNDKEVIFLGQLNHKTMIKKSMDDRRSHRRFRRNKLRYRKSRFLNRSASRKKGRIPPTFQSRVDNIYSIVKKFMKICPLTHVSYENVKFDTQKIRNVEISGKEYQQGTLLNYEVKEYLLEKFDRTCAYCGTKNVPLEIEHIIPKSRGGTNKIDNLTIACHSCNQRKGNKTAEEFGYSEVQKQVKRHLKDAAILNATRWKVYEKLVSTGLNVECGSGALTKMNRIKLGLNKDHCLDACCIGRSTPDVLIFKTSNILQITASGRGNRQLLNLDKYGFPRGQISRQKLYFGFQSGDIIKATVPKGKYKGTWFGSVACRKTGSFNINLLKGRIQGINYKYCQIIQKFDGFKYNIERRENWLYSSQA